MFYNLNETFYNKNEIIYKKISNELKG